MSTQIKHANRTDILVNVFYSNWHLYSNILPTSFTKCLSKSYIYPIIRCMKKCLLLLFKLQTEHIIEFFLIKRSCKILHITNNSKTEIRLNEYLNNSKHQKQGGTNKCY